MKPDPLLEAFCVIGCTVAFGLLVRLAVVLW